MESKKQIPAKSHIIDLAAQGVPHGMNTFEILLLYKYRPYTMLLQCTRPCVQSVLKPDPPIAELSRLAQVRDKTWQVRSAEKQRLGKKG